VINKNPRTLNILKFKRSSDRNEDVLDEANEQHKSIVRRSKRLPRNGRLNRLILWQGGVVQ